MPSTLFDLDVELVESAEREATNPEAARELDEKAALTPGTVNTYAVGIGMCLTCCL
ncbi:hypothetical protein [Streptomyces sp. 891-h]|uniref:hypothetical protein n=1 Tax=Streptomyces sp. 891-h TaxID=2720714 RepID=UPI001FAB1C4D|nr:hypothetical protein [Streptomyces sp. 891-h]UNZ21269.1 hypothetical protein HC362_33540 [Streptomyces sp. 891-h]